MFERADSFATVYFFTVISAEEEHVIQVLGLAGIEAEKLPEATHRTPDLRAHDGDHRYVIEVKTRTDDETLTHELREAGYAFRTSPVAWTSTVATIFQEAMKQLRSVGCDDELKVVWVCVRSRRGAEPTLADQVRHTLYGISRVAGSGRGASAPPCLFFHESIFHRYQDLAGVVIDLGRGAALCLNPFSGQSVDLRSSRLGHFMGSGVFDPAEQELAGHCLIADCDADRRVPERVLAYVSAKYGIEHAVHFNLDEHSGWAVVREDVLDELEAEEELLRSMERRDSGPADGD